MILDHGADYLLRWSAVMSVADEIGCAPQNLREPVKRAELDSGKLAGIPPDTADKYNALKRAERPSPRFLNLAPWGLVSDPRAVLMRLLIAGRATNVMV